MASNFRVKSAIFRVIAVLCSVGLRIRRAGRSVYPAFGRVFQKSFRFLFQVGAPPSRSSPRNLQGGPLSEVFNPALSTMLLGFRGRHSVALAGITCVYSVFARFRCMSSGIALLIKPAANRRKNTFPWLSYYWFCRFNMWQATSARRFSAQSGTAEADGLELFSMACFTSSSLKSPSGPISTSASSPFTDNIFSIKVFSFNNAR